MFALRFISRFASFLAKPRFSQAALLSGYRAMAADSMREHEADEWVEAMIGD